MAKYIKFEERKGEIHQKHPVYDIINKKHGSWLGMIFWNPQWRQYVSCEDSQCIFSSGCHRDIADFMDGLDKTAK